MKYNPGKDFVAPSVADGPQPGASEEMNNLNERQHYVSQVLLRRFRIPEAPLQCYRIHSRTWKPRSVEKACSAPGYNQLVLPEGVNNVIEDSFCRVETDLPATFAALELAANKESTELPGSIYWNMCSYCTFLKQTSPFAKSAAVVAFVAQINMELNRGEYYLLRELNVPDEVISQFRQGYQQGGRIIVQSENVIQLIYRLQFERCMDINYAEFHNCEWFISNSPIDLPMSDVGLIEMRLDDIKAKHYLLPISPRLILEGYFYFDLTKNSRRPISGHTLTPEEAEYRFDVICRSAVDEIVFSRQQPDVDHALNRASAKGITFHRLPSHGLALSSGLKNSTTKYGLQMVTTEDYVKFVHSFVQPPNGPAQVVNPEPAASI
jgi:hypothetical protein